MNSVDLTKNKIFSGGKLNSSDIRAIPLLKVGTSKENFDIMQPSITQDFPHRTDEEFEVRTGMFTGKPSGSFRKERLRELYLGMRCERCGKNISALNSVYRLCLECDEAISLQTKGFDAYEQLGFYEDKWKKENKFVKTNEEANTYVKLFVDSV